MSYSVYCILVFSWTDFVGHFRIEFLGPSPFYLSVINLGGVPLQRDFYIFMNHLLLKSFISLCMISSYDRVYFPSYSFTVNCVILAEVYLSLAGYIIYFTYAWVHLPHPHYLCILFYH